MAAYNAKHAASISDPATFWAAEARQRLHWIRDFDETMQGGFSTGDIAWFMGTLKGVGVRGMVVVHGYVQG